MHFNSSKNIFTVSLLLLWLTVFFLLVTPFLTEEMGTVLLLTSAVCSVISILLIWILLDTRYTIKENHIYYYSGPVRGKIDIASIHKIEHVTTWYAGSLLKPALGSKGLTIRFNKFDDIYISPKEKEAFIAELLKINPEIKVA